MRFPSILGSKLGRRASIRRQNALYIGICVLISLILIAISVSVSFTMVDRDPANIIDDSRKGVVNVDVELVSLDVVTGTLVVDIDPWFNDPNPSSCTFRNFSIYQDGNFFVPGPDSEDIPNTDKPDKPSFQLVYCTQDDEDWRESVPTWRQTLKLFLLPQDPMPNGGGRHHEYGKIGSGLQAYPFDEYYATLSLFAVEQFPNSTRTENISLKISGIKGVVANFDTLKEPWYYPMEEATAPTTGLYDGSVWFTVKRSSAVKIFCFVIVVTNWIVSLVFLWITVACILWKEKVVKELFAIPISVLFAFTAVRGSMPGAPAGFGAFIDYVGILPNFAILTVCSFILIIFILVERIKERSRETEDGSEVNSDETPEKEQITFPIPMV